MSNQIETRMDVECDYWVSMKRALERLENNQDFRMVILDGYFHAKAVNGVSMLSNADVLRGNKRGEIMEALIAISQLQDFFITIKNLGYEEPDGPEVEDDQDTQG